MKLGAWDIGRGPIAAPMAGISNLPYRIIARQMGATLTCAEFVSAKGLVNGSRKTLALAQTAEADHPVSVQIFGADPYIMAEAARIIAAHGADIVDINMGCPVKKVVKTGAGAALMNDPARAAAIVAAVRAAVSVPVTVKMRAGWGLAYEGTSGAGCAPSVSRAVEVARGCIAAGADAVTVHPRTKTQGFSGRAAWNIIGEVAAAVEAPVIGNGDITSGTDAVAMLRETGCAAVMVGRAAIGNPWLFRDIAAAYAAEPAPTPPTPPTPDDIYHIARQHLELMLEHLGEWRGVREYRKHIPWYVRGRRHAARFRKAVYLIDDPHEVLRALDDFFTHGDIPNDTCPDDASRHLREVRSPTPLAGLGRTLQT